MSLRDDITHGVQAGNTNFTCQLLRLFIKADNRNRELLAIGFPNANDVFEAWRTSLPVPDLPYDADGEAL